MRLNVDLDSNSLIRSPGNKNPVTAITFKRGDTARLEVVFSRAGVTQALSDSGATGKLMIKPTGEYQADPLVSDLAWTKEGTGADAIYVFNPDFNVEGLNDALVGTISARPADQAARYALTELEDGDHVYQQDSGFYWTVIDSTKLDEAAGWEVATEEASVSGIAEIQWINDGNRQSTGTFTGRVNNDVIKDNEGIPPDGIPAYYTQDEVDTLLETLSWYGTASVSAAGDSGITKPYETTKTTTRKVTVGAGGGAYTATLSLDTSSAVSGDIQRLILVMPASTNPTIEVRNASSVGTLLYTLAGTGAAFTQLLTFTFNGTAWESDQ